MDVAASRRNLRGAIACAGSESDGLAPPSMIAEGMGSISMRKPRDARLCPPLEPPPLSMLRLDRSKHRLTDNDLWETKYNIRVTELRCLRHPVSRVGGGQNSRDMSSRTGGPGLYAQRRN